MLAPDCDVQQNDTLFWRVDISDLDDDHDGLTNREEEELYLDYDQKGNDGDGMPDGWELAHGLAADDDGSNDPDQGASGDPDGDESDNLTEYHGGTKPLDADSDDDGIGDNIDRAPIWAGVKRPRH
jgi:hypothetical protein